MSIDPEVFAPEVAFTVSAWVPSQSMNWPLVNGKQTGAATLAIPDAPQPGSPNKKPRMTGGLLLLGYLDSNQEQMMCISAMPLPRNWGGIPRISAVFMGSSVRVGTD
jgi:hypothetical protein